MTKDNETFDLANAEITSAFLATQDLTAPKDLRLCMLGAGLRTIGTLILKEHDTLQKRVLLEIAKATAERAVQLRTDKTEPAQ